MTPLVSVILPTYNRLKFLPQAVGSILQQTIANFELIIINDGSLDATEEWLSQQTDQRIKYISYPDNRGASFARNKAIGIAQGKYIAFHDSDDISKKTRFEEQIEVLESNKSLAVCGSNVKVFGSQKAIWKYKETRLPFSIKTLFEIPFHFPACMVRRSFLVHEAIQFRSEIQSADDYYFLIKIIAKGKAHVIQKPLYHYRVHKDSISYKASEEQKANIVLNSQIAFKEILKLTLNKEEIAKLHHFFRNTTLSKEANSIKQLVQKVVAFAKQSTDLSDREKRSLVNFLQRRVAFFDKNWFRLFLFIKKRSSLVSRLFNKLVNN